VFPEAAQYVPVPISDSPYEIASQRPQVEA
jgi:hypothetical protein